ncbi:MAG: hypothetical protein KBA11_07815 [Sedimentibacter sp.]|nr:hypothetical protein [Sedimentibacter sp.]
MAKKTDNPEQPANNAGEVQNIAPAKTEFITLGEKGTCFYDPSSKIFISKGEKVPMPKTPSQLIKNYLQAGGLVKVLK